MPYTQLLEETHKVKFSDNIQMLAQQTQVPLMDAVTRVQATTEAMDVAQLLAPAEYEVRESRSRRNVENPIGAERRWVIYRDDIQSGQYIDKEDKFKAAMDPTSPLLAGHMAAVRRGIHDRILGIKKNNAGRFLVDADLGGIFGGAKIGKMPTGTVTLPASQTVPANATGLTLDKLRAAQLTLNLADFGLEDDDPVYAVLSPHQKNDLIAVAVAAQGGVNAFTMEQIKDGKPTMLMGINWIFTNRLPYSAATGTTRLIPVFTKRNIVAAFWEDIQGRALNDTHADNLPHIKVWANMDATRIQDKGVVVIECVEPAA